MGVAITVLGALIIRNFPDESAPANTGEATVVEAPVTMDVKDERSADRSAHFDKDRETALESALLKLRYEKCSTDTRLLWPVIELDGSRGEQACPSPARVLLAAGDHTIRLARGLQAKLVGIECSSPDLVVVPLQPDFNVSPPCYSLKYRKWTAKVPASLEPLSGSLLALLLSAAKEKDQSLGSLSISQRNQVFAKAYPELSLITAGLGTESLELVRGFLQLMEIEKVEQLQLLGISWSLEHLGTWGMFLLLGVQFYFLVHLRGAGNNMPKAFPWIALYRDRWFFAEIALYVSVCLLPVFTGLRLVFATWVLGGNVWYHLLWVVGLIFCTLFAFETYRELRSLRREVALQE
ncbi:MAG: hypothetical protein GY722_18570 [bacterium]|nr:hypothetical protein [bacterium]